MRRFEFVEANSAKFWMAGVEGAKFSVVYGKIGTAGTRKDKEFPTPEAAQRECDKKIAEKVREGYKEVGEGGEAVAAPTPAPAAKEAKAPAAPEKIVWPSRFKGAKAGADAARAAEAVRALDGALGGRSWRVRRKARAARRELHALGGVDPAAHEGLGQAIEALLGKVVAAEGSRLSLLRALELLQELDAAAYERALASWKASPQASKPVGVLRQLSEQVDEAELALRLGCLAVDRPGRGLTMSEAGWARKWHALSPLVQSYLQRRGGALKTFFQGIDAGGDKALDARLSRLQKG